MARRVDKASKLIHASASSVYRAFAVPGAMEKWMPPAGMTCSVVAFDFREGGSYRMRLKYEDATEARGKTSEDTDEVHVRITKLVTDQRIEQSVTFESDDPGFSGEMSVIWTFTSAQAGTLVEVRCENVPDGISAQDHEAGLKSTLLNLSAFAEGGS